MRWPLIDWLDLLGQMQMHIANVIPDVIEGALLILSQHFTFENESRCKIWRALLEQYF